MIEFVWDNMPHDDFPKREEDDARYILSQYPEDADNDLVEHSPNIWNR